MPLRYARFHSKLRHTSATHRHNAIRESSKDYPLHGPAQYLHTKISSHYVRFEKPKGYRPILYTGRPDTRQILPYANLRLHMNSQIPGKRQTSQSFPICHQWLSEPKEPYSHCAKLPVQVCQIRNR